MQRPSNESHLISSFLNTQTTGDASTYGVEPPWFVTHQPEFRWLVTHARTYGEHPSADALKSRFPDFPLSEATDVAFFVDEVRQDYTHREFVKVIQEAAHKMKEGDLEEALIAWAGWSPPSRGARLFSSYAADTFLEGYGEARDSLEVPWKTLQNLTGGIRPGDYWAMAARQSQGKSWLLGELAAHALMKGERVMLYSLEMSERQCSIRMHVQLGKRLGIKVDHVDMRDGFFPRRDYEMLLGEIRERVPGELFIYDNSESKVTPALIASQAQNASVSLVDYIGLMHTSSGDAAIKDWRIAAEISNNLKEIARSKETRIVVASQINREGETTNWKPPRLHNLSQTDAIGQDADVVVTMKQYSKQTMVYSLEKNRHGAAGIYFWTHFMPNTGVFDEITRTIADSLAAREDDQ